jgi:hypothetical protein
MDNRLTGTIEIEETNKRKFYANLVKDSYVDPTEPDRNFGSSPILYVGDETTYLKYQFEPNDDELFESQYTLNATLSFHMNKAIRKESFGKIYLINEDWEEYTITGNNKPTIQEYITFEIPQDYVGWFDINLGDLLDGVDLTNYSKVSLAANIDTSFFTTYSKEKNSNMAPKLYYSYYYFPPNPAKTLFEGEITVRHDVEDLLYFEFEIDSNWTTDLIPGDIEVPLFEGTKLFEGEVISLRYPDILPLFEGKIEIPTFNGNDLFEAEVHSLAVSIPTFDGELEVQTFDGKDLLYFEMIVEKAETPKFKGELEVPRFDTTNLFPGEFTIYYDEEKLIPGEVSLPSNEGEDLLYFEFEAIPTGIILAEGSLEVISAEGTELFPGEVEVATIGTATFQGEIEVPGKQTLSSYIFIM